MSYISQNSPSKIDKTGKSWVNKCFSHPERMVRLATSFSGIGAIEYAFKRLGLKSKIVFAGDIDENCKRAYFANYPIQECQWHTDIHDFSAKPFLNKVDLLVGGAPCQAFSVRGKHGGFEDTRGTLFREFARLIKECKPKVFIFENVKGLLSHDDGKTWDVIRRTFENDCDYELYFQVLNSKDYGIPQSRERVFCIGFKKETDFIYPKPIKLGKHIYDFLQKKILKKYFLKERGVNFVTRSINIQKRYTQINGDIMLCQKRNQQFNWHGDFVFHPKSYEDRNTQDTDPTLYCVSDYEETFYADQASEHYAINWGEEEYVEMERKGIEHINPKYGRIRKLTPRECLRLMGFDDSFKIVCSDAETYKQAGNSIVVNVLVALLKQMDITKYGYDRRGCNG